MTEKINLQATTKKNMNLVLLGCGRTAALLGRRSKAAGHRIVQIYATDTMTASALAYEWDTESTNYKSLISKDADLYLVAAADDQIREMIQDLHLPGKVVAHTSPVLSAEILKPVSEHYGVFYPIINEEQENHSEFSFCVFYQAATEKALKQLEQFASSVSGNKMFKTDADERMKIFLAALLGGEVPKYLLRKVQEFCELEKINPEHILPSLKETADAYHQMISGRKLKAMSLWPEGLDHQTLIPILENYPDLKKIYSCLMK
ncbi:MAG: DUF2520 domain-containing protein [Chitinophagaceae bacterium]|nr:DUF2520 domain-containing protein [Chitinophagaceae bacterium]